MIKRFCDCCGKEVGDWHGNLRAFSYGVHMSDIVNGTLGGYVDGQFNRISGRDEAWEVCSACYNIIMLPSVKKFHEMRQEAIDSGKLK